MNHFNYTDIAELLHELEMGLTPAELHGMMCGWLCNKAVSDDQWGKMLLASPIVHERLVKMFQLSNQQLADDQFKLTLCLPDDSDSLSVRAKELSLWCTGFLSGLGLASVDVDAYPSLKESIKDLTEFCKLDYASLEENEDNENLFMMLTEHLRTIAMLVYTEIKVNRQSTHPQKHNDNYH
jgi:uncharacterized protein